ncbi:hypothetical protein FOVG_19817 [Fusarium oxysporum f. sp. pisi HDV247]|uniref:Uncharacterized protein n=1 Tax=Fusarium oxysporum f. sp. pisi HDV247 TaxID=1080344 RepID=W9NCY8_FUSOX|nr:hypothetical protein FOVG_19817 [Fusarium oxysporum f. sp. pisi HDV247]
MRLLITFMPFLLPVLASNHKQCDCKINNGDVKNEDDWKYDWQLTFNVCTDNYPKTAEYDNGSGRCIAMPHVRLDGDRYFKNCQKLAKDGWYPVVDGAIDTTQPKITAKHGGSGCYN